jgi:hypothetical protein
MIAIGLMRPNAWAALGRARALLVLHTQTESGFGVETVLARARRVLLRVVRTVHDIHLADRLSMLAGSCKTTG